MLAADTAGASATSVTAIFTDADSPVSATFFQTVRVNPDAGEVIVQLPLAAAQAGKFVEIVSQGALENPPAIRVQPTGGETFVGGATEFVMDTKRESLLVRSDGTNWMLI